MAWVAVSRDKDRRATLESGPFLLGVVGQAAVRPKILEERSTPEEDLRGGRQIASSANPRMLSSALGLS